MPTHDKTEKRPLCGRIAIYAGWVTAIGAATVTIGTAGYKVHQWMGDRDLLLLHSTEIVK